MREPKHIRKIIQKSAYEMTHGGFVPNLPIRKKGKQKRFFIDNEYYEWGYAKNLSRQATLVYFLLAKYANSKTQACFPGMDRIVKEGGISNNRYVSRGLKELEKYNLIFVNRPGAGKVNNYYLLDTSVWKKLPGYEKVSISTKSSVKMNNPESQKELPTKVEFDPLNHRSNSTEEIITKKEKTIEKPEAKFISFFNANYKEQDILLALTEINKEIKDIGFQEVRYKLKQLTVEGKINPIRAPSW